eukprot:scaffold18392_cov129-Isochrysis_galbana.AAC.1
MNTRSGRWNNKTSVTRRGSRWRPAALVPSRQRRTRPWTSVPSGPALWATMRARRRYDCERERARACACKPACTISAHTLAWLLLWLSVRRGSSLPKRDVVSAAKTPSGVAAPPSIHQLRLFNTNHLARGFPFKERSALRSADLCALRVATTHTPQNWPPDATHPHCLSGPSEELAGHDEANAAITTELARAADAPHAGITLSAGRSERAQQLQTRPLTLRSPCRAGRLLSIAPGPRPAPTPTGPLGALSEPAQTRRHPDPHNARAAPRCRPAMSTQPDG